MKSNLEQFTHRDKTEPLTIGGFLVHLALSAPTTCRAANSPVSRRSASR
jgi:hypothetical protein